MKKLVQAQFGMDNVVDFRKVVKAFAHPFPSLASLPTVAKELKAFLFTGEYSPKIKEALDNDSWNGEWAGKVYLIGRNTGEGWKTREMVIEPYCGDRVLIVRDFRNAPVWPSLLCIADYTARPSLNAAQDIINLHNSGDVHRWNDLEWAEVEEVEEEVYA